MKVLSESAEQTKRFGARLSRALKEKDVVLLEGPLGVGKTTFIKGMVKGFGFREACAISPSFTLIREYKKKNITLFHIDLYRIEKSDELNTFGYEEYFFSPCGISIIEWGERIEQMLSSYIKVRLVYTGLTKRKISVITKGYPQEKLKNLKL